jgi:hypothetical protein
VQRVWEITINEYGTLVEKSEGFGYVGILRQRKENDINVGLK